MATITEDYVSFETAKLLTEKGFDNECSGYYNQERVLQRLSACSIKDTLKSPFYFDCIPAPTQQMAMKWLREVHNIFIVIEPYIYDHVTEKNSSCVASLWQGDNYYENITSKDYPTYEEAAEVAIKYCLENLI